MPVFFPDLHCYLCHKCHNERQYFPDLVSFMVGLACRGMWLVIAPLKDLIKTFCLLFDCSHLFKSLTLASPKKIVTLSYLFTCCRVFL